MNRLPAADRGAIEANPFFEGVFAEFTERSRKMLPDADEIEELVVDHLAFVVLGKFNNFLWGHSVHLLLVGCLFILKLKN